jgi:hypothetical protein
MTPLAWANLPVALLFILAWPGIPLRTALGHPDTRLLSGPWFRQRFADAVGTGLNDPPATRPPGRRTTECHPDGSEKKDDEQAPASSARCGRRSAVHLRPHRQPAARAADQVPPQLAGQWAIPWQGGTEYLTLADSRFMFFFNHPGQQPPMGDVSVIGTTITSTAAKPAPEPAPTNGRSATAASPSPKPPTPPTVPTTANTDLGHLGPPLTPAHAREAADPRATHDIVQAFSRKPPDGTRPPTTRGRQHLGYSNGLIIRYRYVL